MAKILIESKVKEKTNEYKIEIEKLKNENVKYEKEIKNIELILDKEINKTFIQELKTLFFWWL